MDSPVWQILWVVAAAIAGGLMYGAWTGPHQSVSNLSRWAVRLRIRRIPGWLKARAADRWAFRGGLVTLVLLLAAAWLVPAQRTPDVSKDSNKDRITPALPGENNAIVDQRPDRHIDAELKNAILVHVPKNKQVKLVVLRDDAEADQFAWEIDAFLRAERYAVMPRMFFAMAAGGQTPRGTTIYPDQSDPNIFVIRIGMNDRNKQ
ncbi:MAG: hypothetical protein QOF91_883 [Alphaproteobacteria bacterium]|jgi:hypothetical protein|nr:hypothetical protein [Alphaproteobacteria bacterium]MEA3025598.1 hypothetical protein [Alphaproteobacteria bacterium]